MTREEHRKIDRLIHAHLMRTSHVREEPCEHGWYCMLCGEIPNYSENLAAAWRVLEEMKKKGYVVGLDFGVKDYSACTIAKREGDKYVLLGSEVDELPSLAACLATLKALGVEWE